MKFMVFIIILLIAIAGCSMGSGSIMPEGSNSGPYAQAILPQVDHWLWSMGLYKVSEDHISIEHLSNRIADYHFNVTPFVEPPNCKQCLMIGKPQIQQDGTMKVKVMLTHPFPGQPEYTGFDVRGVIMFPATRYWKYTGIYGLITRFKHIVCKPVPVYFSLAQDGGAQLLNPDGYTIYFFPGFDLGDEFNQPVFKYSKGKYAYGPDPDSTINAFKLFTNDPERRMFKTTETISRTYYIDPPDGEFTFGYVIDASWVPPTKKPVTDPKNDFPLWANCEDGYVLKTEWLQPIKSGGGDNNGILSQTTFLVSWWAGTVGLFDSVVLCPEIAPIPEFEANGIAEMGGFSMSEIGAIKIEHRLKGAYAYIYTSPPGKYPAVVITTYSNYHPQGHNQLAVIHLFDIITLEVE